MYSTRGRLRNAVNGMRFLSPQSNLDDTGVILNQPANRLPTQAPDLCKLADPIVFFETWIIGQHLRLPPLEYASLECPLARPSCRAASLLPMQSRLVSIFAACGRRLTRGRS